MSTNSYIVLTEAGLSAVATQPWPQIAIKYFLPMYDERIDNLIHSEAGATAYTELSASITSADSQASLIGERIYNIPSTSGTYELTTKNVASSGVGSSLSQNVVLNSTVNKSCSRTILNGKTLAPTYSGDVEPTYYINNGQLQFVGGSAVSTTVHNWTDINGSNIPRENLFDSVTFNPTQVTSGSYNVISGLFKFTLRNNIGSYRFNKIAFFIQPMNEDGSVNESYDPILFGQTVVNTSQIVEVGGEGSQTFEVTIQLAFTIKDSMVVLTNNDYWSMIPTSASTRNQNGLFFAGDVALGTSSVPNSWQPRAKFQITDDTGGPQLRLANTDALSGFDVTFIDSPTSAMVSHVIPLHSDGVGYTWGISAYAVGLAAGGGQRRSAFALGDFATAVRSGAYAIGAYSSAIAYNSYIFGLGNTTNADAGYVEPSFALGYSNYTLADQYSTTIAVGSHNNLHGGMGVGYYNHTSGGFTNFAFGVSNYAGCFLTNPHVTDSLAFGFNSSAFNRNAYAIGTSNFTSAPFSYAAGHSNKINGSGLYNYAIGFNNQSDNNTNSFVAIFGTQNNSNYSLTTLIGHSNSIGANNAVAVGVGNSTSAVAIGVSNKGSGYTFGKDNDAHLYSVALGLSAKAYSYQSVSIGVNVKNINGVYNSISSTNPKHSNTSTSGYLNNTMVGIDLFMADANYDSVIIGSDSHNNTKYGETVNIGYKTTTTRQSISIGSWSRSYGTASIALGTSARCMAGSENAASYDSSQYGRQIAIGYAAMSYGYAGNMAIGSYALSETSGVHNALAFGTHTITKNINVIAGTRINMTTVGVGLTNAYAAFMAGLLPATLTKMESNLSASCANWTFLPTTVFGNGGGVGRNGLMVGIVNRTTDNVSVVALDYDSMPTIGQEGIPIGLPAYYQDCPPGTIFRYANPYGSTSYGFSPLYIWNGTGARD